MCSEVLSAFSFCFPCSTLAEGPSFTLLWTVAQKPTGDSATTSRAFQLARVPADNRYPYTTQ